MKKFLKFFSLLLVLGLVFVIAACDDPIIEDEDVEISFLLEEVEVEVGKTITLEYDLTEGEFELEWSSDAEAIATVSNAGVVSGVKAGNANITVKVKDADAEATIKVVVKPIPIEEIPDPVDITLAEEITEGTYGDTFKLEAIVLPAKANQEVVWESDNEGVAIIDEDGNVELVGVGEVYITVSSKVKPSITKEYLITVAAPAPSEIVIKSEDDITELPVFSTLQLSVEVTPEVAVKRVIWSVDDAAVAEVAANGLLTAKAEGVVVVTATSEMDEDVTATFEVTISRPLPVSMEFEPVESILELNDPDFNLKANLLPNIAVQDVLFKSSDDNVVTVDENGKISVVGVGEAIITVTSVANSELAKDFAVIVHDQSLMVFQTENILLDIELEYNRFETFIYDGVEYIYGLNAVKNAAAAFALLEEGSTLNVLPGTYSQKVTIKYDNITILGPNAGMKAGKVINDRPQEAIFTNTITLDGVKDVKIDGIALTGSGQIRSEKPNENITIININSYDANVSAAEGIIFLGLASGTEFNKNIVVKRSRLGDDKGVGYRGVRVNNVDGLVVEENYLLGFFDAIRLEGEGNAAMGAGTGATGVISIKNNEFENNIQYPIWIGTTYGTTMDITTNRIGVAANHAGVYGLTYIYVGDKQKEAGTPKSVINILKNEVPVTVFDWHNFRINSNGASSSELEVNVTANIFYDAPGRNDGGVAYFLIADHAVTPDSSFKINGADNYFLFVDEDNPLEAGMFANTLYEPYFTEMNYNFFNENQSYQGMMAPKVNPNQEYYVSRSTLYKYGESAWDNIEDALAGIAAYTDNNRTLIFADGKYDQDFELNGKITISSGLFTGVITLGENANVTFENSRFTEGAQIVGPGAVDGFAFMFSHVFDLTLEPSDYVPNNRIDVNAFIRLYASTGESVVGNVTVSFSKFTNIKSDIISIARTTEDKNVQITNNEFKNFGLTAIRFDGGYNNGNYMINDNIFKNHKLSASAAIVFRAYSASAGKTQFIEIKNNHFENIGDVNNMVRAETYGASAVILTSVYNDVHAHLEVSKNKFINTVNPVHLRNAGGADSDWEAVFSQNTFRGSMGTIFYEVDGLAELTGNIFLDKDGVAIPVEELEDLIINNDSWKD